MTEPRLQTLYSQIGAEMIEELVEIFYPKVYANPVISPLFEGDMEEIRNYGETALVSYAVSWRTSFI